MTKLIRDRVMELPWDIEEAKRAVRLPIDEAEVVALLDRKLLEEVSEFLVATDLADRLDEAGDVLDVLAARLARLGQVAPIESIVLAAARKRMSRGGFEAGLVFDLHSKGGGQGADLAKSSD